MFHKVALWSDFWTGDVAGLGVALAIYVLLLAASLWALREVARRQRTGVVAMLGLAAVLHIGLSLGTFVVWCPSPCQTAWPLMEASNWAGLVIGVLVWIVGLALVMPARGEAQA